MGPLRVTVRDIGDYIKACQNVGTESHKLHTMFEMLTLQSQGTCYNCHKRGHFIKDCPQRNKQRSLSKKGDKVCQRCLKSSHSVKMCRSKFHKDGYPLDPSGNTRRGARPGAPKQYQGYSLQSSPQQTAECMSINSSRPPKGVPAWTWPPPRIMN